MAELRFLALKRGKLFFCVLKESWVVYVRNHYFGLGPIPKPKNTNWQILSADTVTDTVTNTVTDTVTDTVTNTKTTF